MDYFHSAGQALWCEETPLRAVAEAVGTPCFVYSRRTIELHYGRLVRAFDGVPLLVCYSVKANSNLAVLDVLRRLGSGFDVVSQGEMRRALAAGSDPKKIVFAGVGKTDGEIAAALDAGILMFNVESESELDSIERVARARKKTAAVALRVNPDVDPKTHTYISTGKRENKFGIDIETAERLVRGLPKRRGLRMIGVHAHIGSQITEIGPHVEALGKCVAFAARAKAAGNPVEWLNMGGGFGIYYRGGEAKPAAEFGAALVPMVRRAGLRLAMEPGRFIVGNAGVLLARVLRVKDSGERRFVVVDAAMNDLIRPALYGAHHRIWPVEAPFPESEAEARGDETVECDVVGPICESSDFLAKERRLPPVRERDLLCVFSAGAYGMTMSSNYNSRPRAAEVMVDGKSWTVVRKRETHADVVRGERTLPAPKSPRPASRAPKSRKAPKARKVRKARR